MIAELINGWWLSTDTHLGTNNTSGITDKQIHNAQKVYAFFRARGWSLSAVAGMIGNFQVESFMSPAYIQGTNRSRLPNSAASLSDVPNSVMINFYKEYYSDPNRGYGVGIAQWDGYTDLGLPHGQKLVSYAIRNNWDWYNGDTQMNRIIFEKDGNWQWEVHQIQGIQWTWDNFPTNDQTPEISAYIWSACYESADIGTLPTRQSNARYWYDYFIANPGFIPGDWFYYLFGKSKGGLKNVRRNYSRRI